MSWLVAIAGQHAAAAGAQPPAAPSQAAAAALDALHLLCRDDRAHWRMLSTRNIADVLRLRARMHGMAAAAGCAAEQTRCEAA